MQNDQNPNTESEDDGVFPTSDEKKASPDENGLLTQDIKANIPKVDWAEPSPEANNIPDEVEEIPEDTFPAEEAPAEVIEVESKTHLFLRKIIRWTAGILIIFGLGLITAVFAFYIPARKQAEANTIQYMAELDSANAQVANLENQVKDLKTQIASLQPYKDKNDELVEEQRDLNLQITILSARVDVANALRALKDSNVPQAHIYLDQTSKTLDKINSLLSPTQQEVTNTLQEWLNLVMSELDTDTSAAQTALEGLGDKLLQLQDSLIRR